MALLSRRDAPERLGAGRPRIIRPVRDNSLHRRLNRGPSSVRLNRATARAQAPNPRARARSRWTGSPVAPTPSAWAAGLGALGEDSERAQTRAALGVRRAESADEDARWNYGCYASGRNGNASKAAVTTAAAASASAPGLAAAHRRRRKALRARRSTRRQRRVRSRG
jgi:hypothetical protein